MKKILSLLLALAAMAYVFAACSDTGSGGGAAQNETITDPLDEVMAQILDNIDDLPMPMDTEITEENFKAYLFIDYIDGSEALASDAAIGAIAHSVCLLRLPEDVDAASAAEDIEANADPRKWICVEAEKVIVRQRGNLILLVMSSAETADAIAANFDGLVA